MLFNSFQFITFFIVVLILLFSLPHRFRWILLLAASAYFYMCWNPFYIVFLIFVIVVDYFCGIGMGNTARPGLRKLFLGISLFSNIGLLFTFKYFNFFSNNASALLGHRFPLLHLILPIGISFHVFQSLAYTIDVYRKRIEPERHAGLFALFVMFFPQLVAGPIERPQNLLHQFREKKQFTYENFRSGAQLALWGMIKKVCIADLLAAPVSRIYGNPTRYPGPILLLATFYFTVQIYCDFSGYTDIARGVARIMGYNLMVNFRQPYFARSIKEFWQRWHISLSTWFRDYVYFPLGGSRVSRMVLIRNLFVVFVVSGLWHGAAWTFVIWGALHGCYMIFGELTRSWRTRILTLLNFADTRVHYLVQIFITLNLVMIGWVFFRADGFQQAWYIVRHMYIPSRITFYDVSYGMGLEDFPTLLAWSLIGALIAVDYALVYKPKFILPAWNWRPFRWAVYTAGAYSLIFFGVWERIQFIYFQF